MNHLEVNMEFPTQTVQMLQQQYEAFGQLLLKSEYHYEELCGTLLMILGDMSRRQTIMFRLDLLLPKFDWSNFTSPA